MATPIRPDGIQKGKKYRIPDAVIEIFNRAIEEDWDGHEATVKVKDVMPKIVNALMITEEEVYSLRLLDIEDIYRQQGWDVRYDSAAIGHSDFDPYFEFKHRTRS